MSFRAESTHRQECLRHGAGAARVSGMAPADFENERAGKNARASGRGRVRNAR
jgi:hypothetical protein